MGLIAVAIGAGSADAAMLHSVNHSLTKGMLFLLAGNILSRYRSRATNDVTGLLKTLPVTGMLWVAGFLAITGSPPFGPFVSEYAILRGCFAGGHEVVGVVVLALLVLVFLGMARAVLRMAHGAAPAAASAPAGEAAREPWLAVAPPAVLATLVIGLGVYVPPLVLKALHDAAAAIGGP
jgi:hydrogenase-4 component F